MKPMTFSTVAAKRKKIVVMPNIRQTESLLVMAAKLQEIASELTNIAEKGYTPNRAKATFRTLYSTGIARLDSEGNVQYNRILIPFLNSANVTENDDLADILENLHFHNWKWSDPKHYEGMSLNTTSTVEVADGQEDIHLAEPGKHTKRAWYIGADAKDLG